MLPQLVSEDIFEKSPAFMAVLLGENFTFSEANARYRELVGNRDIIGKPLLQALPEIVDQGFFEILQNVYRTGETFEGKEIPVNLITRIDSDPKQVYVSFIYRRISDASGNPSGIFVFGIEVTDLVLSRKQVEASELQFRQFIDSMPQMAFIADKKGDITYFNKPWYDYIKGLENTEGWGWKDKPIHHPDDLDYTIARWTHSLKTGEPYEIEYRLRRHDGQYRWHLGRATPVKDESGKILRWIGTNTDIHENKETETKLAAALKSRDEFLSIASHELKTPLTALNLQNEIFKRSVAKEAENSIKKERVSKIIEQNEKQIYRLTKLVDDMLDVSRISSGKVILAPVSFDLSKVIHENVERFQPYFLEKGFPLIMTEIPESIQVKLDQLKIEQVLTNLLSNALKYGDRKQVMVSVMNFERHVEIKVSDRGIGISPSVIGKIFDKFERDINSYDISGLGLGLYISRSIIDAHGGSITAVSSLGKGSTFTVSLPYSATASSISIGL